ncbi:hypothetical protein PPERSA_01689 [Pseudocohnilembus persalinus]|uniref:Uncharacterized protein n=1 Tax=Pseudocohnilembus persalinus TaxID=266149 RepID=A0A0V0R1I1_PSEPJ|nr:hypothetical protein PPERSA_01689 [Pseudocohnilembus persalinus]|eukprot:KRX08144.1 hypothetical protein PPERSA_01689 [Pseudocohnilembus persalinus]
MNASPHINSNTQRNISAKEELFFLTKEMNHIMRKLSHFQLTLDEKVSNFICCSKVFHPYNSFNLINNIVENIMIIMCLFLYTLFCFFDFFQEDFFFWVVIASLIVFSSGTFLRINTGYFDQGIIIFDRMNLNGNMVYVWQLIKMVSTTLALCHFVGTAFFWIAVMEKFYLDQYSWVEAQGFWDEPIHYQYVLSFYQLLH